MRDYSHRGCKHIINLTPFRVDCNRITLTTAECFMHYISLVGYIIAVQFDPIVGAKYGPKLLYSFHVLK